MKTLTRYVLREFLVPLGYCLTGFISIYVLFDLFGSFSRMHEARLPFLLVLRYFCGYLAPYFHYIVPAALMLATLYTMWMFCRHSELVAMRASGISFLTIVKPLLTVALLMSAAVFGVSEFYVPLRASWAAQMKTYKFELNRLKMAENIVFRNAKEGRTWNVGKLVDDDGRHLEEVRVTVDRPNGGPRLFNLMAERADYLDGEWWFTKPTVQHYDETGRETKSLTPEQDKLEFRCFAEFREEPRDFVMQNRPWKFNSISDRFRYLHTHPELTKAAHDDCLYDAWARIMMPWACIVITLFAIPAGIASGRQSVFKGILGAIGMYFSFYGFDIAMMVLAKNGWCPPIPAAILPCLIFLILGIWTFRKQR